MAAFSNLHIIGESWAVSKFGTLLVFPGFIVAVPLTALNLVIAVLSKAMDSAGAEDDDHPVTKFDIKKLQQSITELKQGIANGGQRQ